MMVQRSVIFLLVVVFFVGCDEEESDKVKPKEVVDEGPKKRIIWEKDGAEMVLIPEGFGRTKGKYDEFGDLVPGGVVSDLIYMDTTEVTVGQFKKFLKSSGYKPKDPIDWANKVYVVSPTDKHPMIWVSWFDAVAYAKWAGKRLPTEAEWEFAARGGLVDKTFTWGDDESVSRQYANYKGTGGKDKWDKQTAPVGSFKPNGYGLHDMAGNVWEWCQDCYDKIICSLRGGSWVSNAKNYLRVANRYIGDHPSNSSYCYGFRCVVDVP